MIKYGRKRDEQKKVLLSFHEEFRGDIKNPDLAGFENKAIPRPIPNLVQQRFSK